MLAVKSPGLLVMVTDVVALGLDFEAANVPLLVGVVGSVLLTVITPTSAFMLPVHETVALCDPDGGLMTWKIIVRAEVVVPESVPGITVAGTPPRLAVMLVAVLAVMATMIMAARLGKDPMENVGVVTFVTPNCRPALTLLSNATPAGDTVSVTVIV